MNIRAFPSPDVHVGTRGLVDQIGYLIGILGDLNCMLKNTAPASLCERNLQAAEKSLLGIRQSSDSIRQREAI